MNRFLISVSLVLFFLSFPLSAARAPQIIPRPTLLQITAAAKSADAPPARNDSGWFLFFFALFGAGVILVILSLPVRK